ncbi:MULTISPECIES: hypothetical protein [Streptomyces]|uniref:ABC transporter permease n=1 Tax=Streptomyces nondiastaticus TaxID=3154512 RepID=A0ABW6TRK7_9ACTN|nr:hypothetical protein [Streptomyces sp. VNUA116]WKU47905.1 hypothetical protein Q3V23_29755 [Streptomyces sp. VNUA116]
MNTAVQAGPLARALASRTWRHQGRHITLVPLGAGLALVVLLLVLPRVYPEGIHGDVSTASSDLATVTGLHGTTGAALGAALLSAPGLLGVAAGLITLSISRAVIAGDLTSGVMEALLATPLRLRAVFLAYTGTALAAALLAWLTLVAAFTGPAWAVLTAGGGHVHLTTGYVLLGVLVPAGSMLWAASVTVFTAFLYPAGLRATAGLNGGLVRAVGLLPTLGATLAVALAPGKYTQVTAWYAGGSLTLATALLVAVPLVFKADRLLE